MIKHQKINWTSHPIYGLQINLKRKTLHLELGKVYYIILWGLK